MKYKGNTMKKIIIWPCIILLLSSCSLNFGTDTFCANAKDSSEMVSTDGQKEETPSSATDDSTLKGAARRELTIVIYMAADNDLEAEGIADLNEMEAASYDHEKMSVLALLDRSDSYDRTNGDWSDTRLFEVVHDDRGVNGTIVSKQIDCPPLNCMKGTQTELNMSDPAVLASLLSFARTSYTAEQYALVIWGHGTGWRCARSTVCQSQNAQPARAVAVDDDSKTYMTLSQLHKAIQSGMEKGKLCFIGFDTCFGMELEEVYELHDCTLWTAGSAGVDYAAGWNYESWLTSCANNHEDGQSLALHAETDQVASGDDTFSIVDEQKIGKVFFCFDELALLAAKEVTDNETLLKMKDILFTKIKKYEAPGESSSVFADVYSFAEELSQQYPALAAKAEELKTAVSQAVVTTGRMSVFPLGVCLCMKTAQQTVCGEFPVEYIQGSGAAEQCLFVRTSKGYVPTVSKSVTLLNKIFYSTFKE